VVLIGQPELRQRVAKIPQLSQRVAVRAHLAPFTAEETKTYILSRLEAAGRRGDVFTKEAMELVHELTQGIGRLINALCDACLMAGAQEHVREIDAALVRRVHEQS
jgi:type II secretory pathway predicted ATPase ExeA